MLLYITDLVGFDTLVLISYMLLKLTYSIDPLLIFKYLLHLEVYCTAPGPAF